MFTGGVGAEVLFSHVGLNAGFMPGAGVTGGIRYWWRTEGSGLYLGVAGVAGSGEDIESMVLGAVGYGWGVGNWRFVAGLGVGAASTSNDKSGLGIGWDLSVGRRF